MQLIIIYSLINLGLVRNECPVTATHSKSSIYILDDWMFIIWYQFVQPDLSRIIGGFGECKWRNTQIGDETLADIKRKSNLFSEFSHKEIYLFSKSEFANELNNRSKREGNITLIGVDDMFMRVGG